MPSPAVEYVITTLAEYQTVFWSEVATVLKKNGQSVSVISFDDNSTEMLKASGLRVYSATTDDWRAKLSAEETEARIAQFGLKDTPHWYAHEKANFGVWNDAELDHRMMVYLSLSERALADVVARGAKPVLIQELGGFLSVIAAYAAAERIGVDNWFIEPAFFKGRIFWTRNSFAAPVIHTQPGASPEALAYLEAAMRDRAIVIPDKDRHQYRGPFKKVVSFKNLKRLVEKVVDKYLRGRKQEFGHVWAHASRHVKMIFASAALRRHYVDLEQVGRFVYYPLHVPGDMALTLRSPAYLDQIALIDTISRQMPRGWTLAIKEHPAMIGAMGAAPLKDLLNRRRNVVLLSPGINNYDVIARCDALVSVNSKSGAEAILLGKPVVVLGDAFYKAQGLTIDVASSGDVGAALTRALSETPPSVDAAHREAFFSSVWRESHPGEIYVGGQDNVQAFAAGMLAAVALKC